MTATLSRPMTKKATKEAERAESIAALRKLLKPGDTVYTVLRGVSPSGMSRRIDVYIFRKNEPQYLSGWVADVLDLKRHPSKDGMMVHGCGMDMGFHVVYEMGRILFPGWERPGGGRDGGYALNHRWL